MNLSFTHIALGALVVLAAAGGVIMTIWPRASAGEIQVVEIAPTASPAPTSTPMPSETQVGVYISGAVINPGVYIVNGGSRLANVLLLAGGATAEADLTAVNLAAVVHDEDHWHIPEAGQVAPPKEGLAASGRDTVLGGAAQPNGSSAGKVDLNDANVELLKTLPGIGEVRAQAIVSHREANGNFASVDALLDVNGIGIGTVESIRDLVTVE